MFDTKNIYSWLKSNADVFKNISRGIERETLRINKNGNMSDKNHPYMLGSALTNKWITTDFSENLLEFVTPTNTNIDYILSFLSDLHHYTITNIHNEHLWPFSFPNKIYTQESIRIAQYGISNIGQMKMLYRKGLKYRYGSLMNIISGIHYNFSLPIIFWKKWKGIKDIKSGKDIISSGYLQLIRNYHKFGWIIPYLFGASPAIHCSFLNNKTHNINFKKSKNGLLYLPWGTSLRLSSIGHKNYDSKEININFNHIYEYIQSLRYAINTPSKKFQKIGLKDSLGNKKQINDHYLQTESEFYTHIRPKQKTKKNESLLNALENRGIQYVEIRSLDINPFSAIGINKKQILLLDLFLIWCVLTDSPEMHTEDLIIYNKNWQRVLLEGRKPNQMIYTNNKNEEKKLIDISKKIFNSLYNIAEILDQYYHTHCYKKICKEFAIYLEHPELTYSAKILNKILKYGYTNTGLYFSKKYHTELKDKYINTVNYNIFLKEALKSHIKQQKLENNHV
ncbi:MAG TPA: glutamate--cysteine ligase [Buchnera sp. (in: enterobacteria)]|nr:glutamate--cysteine ligase [Buchnera sp. (in: enterobacteria)]